MSNTLPFGETRNNTKLPQLTDLGYTGQILDRSSGGLMYYNARYYLPKLRRFISADTVVPSLTSSQAWNRYSYVNNNPINYNDPSGHYSVPKIAGGYSDLGAEDVVSYDPNKVVEILRKDVGNWQLVEELEGNVLPAVEDTSDYDIFPDPVDPGVPANDSCGICKEDPWVRDRWWKTKAIAAFMPDYTSFDVGYGLWKVPFGGYVGPTGSISLDGYGNLYWTVGLEYGATGKLGFSLNNGFMLRSRPLPEEEMENFLSGTFLNIYEGAGGGGGLSWTSPFEESQGKPVKESIASNVAAVGGIGTPQAGISWTQTWFVFPKQKGKSNCLVFCKSRIRKVTENP